MIAQLKTETKSLYDIDYNLWVLDTVNKLENKEFNDLDLDNLIEEVSALSRRDKKKLKSLLRNLLEHLLKIKYWESEIERNQSHWRGEIMNFRQLIRDELQDSPSLKRYLSEIYEECYQDAREIASIRSQLPLETFPKNSIEPLEQILDENWLP
ncbi:DUF29 domain-containing protein [Geminocystis sp. CENA526]|uniref:DUF29 domain-containing protein n=1 Tax=Geminocystis sp. CENA526 TaxID=1355871 RepID=UPI003D6EE13B